MKLKKNLKQIRAQKRHQAELARASYIAAYGGRDVNKNGDRK